MSPTFTGTPARVSASSDNRRAPHTPIAATRPASTAAGTHRSRDVRPTIMSATAALTATSSADSPYTPTRLATCAIGSTVTWQRPRKPDEEVAASQLGRHPHERRGEEATRTDHAHDPMRDEREHGRIERLNGNQREVHEHGDDCREAAVQRHHARDPVERD